jgi:muramoyltetrapeptide carboxypeptidase
MKRSSFLKTAGLAALAPGIMASPVKTMFAAQQVFKPKRLQAGQSVGLIAPGCFVSEAELQKAIHNLEGLGLLVVPGQHLTTKYGYFSGTDRERAADINRFFADSSISGVFCARGGYGSLRVLPHLDYELIKANPKPLCGYSDATALHQALFVRSGLVSFHGPVGISTFNEFSTARLKEMLFGEGSGMAIPLRAKAESDSPEWEVLRPGTACGVLAGGNLSVLSSLAGTPFAMGYKDCILYLEETDEEPYRIDRMLTQLALSGAFTGVKAVVLGAFTNCVPSEKSTGIANSFTLQEIFRQIFLPLSVPVVSGALIGHIKNKVILPFGLQAELDTGKAEIRLAEPCIREK